ncbi:hypothetical protein FRX31_019291, partial [Thalictrum thalictroides]
MQNFNLPQSSLHNLATAAEVLQQMGTHFPQYNDPFLASQKQGNISESMNPIEVTLGLNLPNVHTATYGNATLLYEVDFQNKDM